jgi:23S rRNA G2069 N7-methylase RlmK/C1962 C5-methylase RlmI
MAMNGFSGSQHQYVQSDTGMFLERLQKGRRRFTVAVVDPPSFFTYGSKKVNFDINRDHRALIQSVLSIMAPGSTVFFSSNHQRFEPRLDALGVRSISELTPSTIPEDYRNRKIHRCWKIDT